MVTCQLRGLYYDRPSPKFQEVSRSSASRAASLPCRGAALLLVAVPAAVLAAAVLECSGRPAGSKAGLLWRFARHRQTHTHTHNTCPLLQTADNGSTYFTFDRDERWWWFEPAQAGLSLVDYYRRAGQLPAQPDRPPGTLNVSRRAALGGPPQLPALSGTLANSNNRAPLALAGRWRGGSAGPSGLILKPQLPGFLSRCWYPTGRASYAASSTWTSF